MDYRQTLHAIPPAHPASYSANCLIVKDDVGRSKPSCRDLPTEGHRYGSNPKFDKEGVKELLTWQYSRPVARPQETTQDFRRLNKMAVSHGIFDARDQTILRDARRDVTVSPSKALKPQSTKDALDQHPNFTYGRPPRPSSPIQRVLSHDFGREGQERTAARYEAYYGQKDSANVNMKIKLTTAARGHAIRSVHRMSVNEFDAFRGSVDTHAQPFKMKKFLKVGPRTDTYLVNETYEATHPEKYSVNPHHSARRAEQANNHNLTSNNRPARYEEADAGIDMNEYSANGEQL